MSFYYYFTEGSNGFISKITIIFQDFSEGSNGFISKITINFQDFSEGGGGGGGSNIFQGGQLFPGGWGVQIAYSY